MLGKALREALGEILGLWGNLSPWGNLRPLESLRRLGETWHEGEKCKVKYELGTNRGSS